jgi:hypothetical protein
VVAQQHPIHTFFTGAGRDQDAGSRSKDQDRVKTPGSRVTPDLHSIRSAAHHRRRRCQRLGQPLQSALRRTGDLAAEEDWLSLSSGLKDAAKSLKQVMHCPVPTRPQ